MTDLVERIEASIHSRRLFRAGEKLLVAVSGGLDSMVLLHVLSRLAGQNKWRLTVAHFNHCLRGRSSDADERLVRKTALQLGLPSAIGRGKVREFAHQNKLSEEMAARKLRHRFLAQVARKRGIQIIAVAHHADDQVELFFLRLLRGVGAGALAGMKWNNPSPEDSKIRLVRPLLDIPRSELEAFVAREKIPFREDVSNARLDIKRNRLRHELLPLLVRHYQPALAKVILRQMEILGAESEFVGGAAENWLRQKRRPKFETLPVAVQRRCLQLQLAKKNIAANYDLIEQIRLAAGRIIAVNPYIRVSRDDGGLVRLHPHRDNRPNTVQMEQNLTGKRGEFAFENVVFNWEIVPQASGTFRAPKGRANRECLDAAKVGSTIVLRHWQPGDRFQPIGMNCPVKLQDLFTNRKILPSDRRQMMVAATVGGEIFWVEGLRVAEKFKLDPASKRRLQWRWKRV